MAQRWIWIVVVNGKPCRFTEDGGCSQYFAFASGFGSHREANATKVRQRKEYWRLQKVCEEGGSPKGAASWKQCAETICVVRIELPKDVR